MNRVAALLLIAVLIIFSKAWGGTVTLQLPAHTLEIPASSVQFEIPDPPEPVVLPYINVSKYGAVPGDGIDDAPAINRALESNRMVYFPAGQYDLLSPIGKDGLENLHLFGTGVLVKAAGFRGEYIARFNGAQNLEISGLSFRGLTTDRITYKWGEQGLGIFGARNVKIQNCRFFDFGDAGLRIASSVNSLTVDSFNATVRDNFFDNVTQVTTTQAVEGAGTAGYLFENNVLFNLKGSVKLASRGPGAGESVIAFNRIYGNPAIPTSVGIELSSVSNVLVIGNVVRQTGGLAINAYTNTRAPKGFAWGALTFQGNDVQGRIRVDGSPYADGFIPAVRAKDTGNRYDGITAVNGAVIEK